MAEFLEPGEVIEIGSDRYYQWQEHKASQEALKNLTLRDQFAMAALTGLVGGYLTANRAESWDNFAAMAYYAADAMLTARATPLP